jgi:ATP-dependent DNA helicase PIF1
MLCWHDMRFARHARWRFFVFNLYMRRITRSMAQFYVSRTSGLTGLNREELTAALNTDAALLPQIVRQGARLPGTRPYWQNRGSGLQAHARFLCTDTAPVFLTLSCADMQWHDLQRHLPRFDEYVAGDDRTRQRIVWANVQDYPHIVAHYLDIRVRAFIQHVVRPTLDVTDHWTRYEWQFRGSGHIHCLFWTRSAPPLDPSTDAQRAALAVYWGRRITAWNPDPSRLPDARNPASIAPTDVTNTADQFAAFVNRLQMHSACRASYCLRTKKGTAQPTCRFFFPRPLAAEPSVTKEISRKDWMFAPARNQELMNQCMPVITMGWMANTDVQPSVTLHGVLQYLSKYASKPEKSSVSYTELQAQVLPYTNSRAPLLSFVSRLLNKLIGERDWSAQEVSHILLGLPMSDASRQVVTLDCRREEGPNDLITVGDEAVTARRSPLRRYQDRLRDRPDLNLAGVTLFEWLRDWDWNKLTVRPRAPQRVINYFPRFSAQPASPQYDDYCRVRLMLHHPFERLTDLLSVDGHEYGSFPDAFEACVRLHDHPDDFYTDPLADDPESESDEESEHGADDDEPLADFEAFARRRPACDDMTCSFTDNLGSRELDRAYDWTSHIGRNLTTPEAWDQFRMRHQTEQAVMVNADPSPLNTEQRKVYDVVTAQYAQELDAASPRPRPLLLNVDGVAGSGKTFTILKTCARLQELADEAGRGNPVVRAAPTGVAAFNFVGQTLHSLFRLPVKRKACELSPATVQSL